MAQEPSLSVRRRACHIDLFGGVILAYFLLLALVWLCKKVFSPELGAFLTIVGWYGIIIVIPLYVGVGVNIRARIRMLEGMYPLKQPKWVEFYEWFHILLFGYVSLLAVVHSFTLPLPLNPF